MPADLLRRNLKNVLAEFMEYQEEKYYKDISRRKALSQRKLYRKF